MKLSLGIKELNSLGPSIEITDTATTTNHVSGVGYIFCDRKIIDIATISI